MEKSILMSAVSDTCFNYPSNRTVIDLFEEQVMQNYYKTALVHNGIRMTYGLINEKANRVARFLKEKGIGTEKVAAIMLEQGIDRIVAILGILKAGGAYLPIEKNYPVDRIQHMLRDSEAKIVLTDSDLAFDYKLEQERLDQLDLSHYQHSNLDLDISSQNLMYIIYTSGSTGKPKGVMVEHRSVVRLVKNTNYIDFLENDKMLQGCSIQFDVSIFEIWGALLNGIELHLVEKSLLIDSELLEQYFRTQKITIVWMTTPLFNSVSEQNPRVFDGLRCLLVGGDALSPKHIEWVRIACPNVRIINGYGPTENTTFSSYFVIDREYKDNIPIGKPISNSTAYVMDDKQNIVPVGTVGELCVGGDGVSRGYINRPELNAEKFVQSSGEIGRIYRTGDLAKMLPDGNIEFLGRVDNQVKIRGYRIELNEVERAVVSHSDITEAVVLVKEYHDKYLCCFYKGKRSVSPSDLRNYLQEKIPNHMIPTKMIQISQFPFNSSGKIDRNQLMKVDEQSGEIIINESTTILEREIVDICKEVLGFSSISIQDNFYELGLNSLVAIKLLIKIRKKCQVDLKVRDILENYTVEMLGKIVEKTAPLVENEIPLTEEQDYHEVSSAQKRMYLSSLIKGDLTYNIPVVAYFKKQIDAHILQQALIKLIERNESLRTTFHFINNSVYQKIHKNSNLKIEFYIEDKDVLLDGDISKYLELFNLEKAPLLSAKVISLRNNNDALLLNVHHTIFDGLSVQIFFDELMELYHGKTLKELPIQYKDYAKWHNQCKSEEQYQLVKKIWQDKFSTDPKPALLPYLLDGAKDEMEDNFVDTFIEKQTINIARSFLNEKQSSLYIFFTAILGVQIAKYSNEEDVVITSVMDGRPKEEFQHMIGMFVDTFPLRFDVKKTLAFDHLLSVVRKKVMEAQEHPFPFDELITAISKNTNKSISQVVKSFNILMVLEPRIEVKQEEIREINTLFSTGTSKFDLTLIATEVENGYQFRVEFDRNLFSRYAMEKFIGHYKELLTHFAYNPNQSIIDFQLSNLHELNLSTNVVTDETISHVKMPTSEIEQLLVDIWCEVLHMEEIGTNDRFLEIGGDSIKAIQIASRLQKRGLKVKVNQILIHQTIAKISPLVTRKSKQRNNHLVEGVTLLTPIEQWYFEKNMENQNHFNQSMVWQCTQEINPNDVKQLFDKLVEHHDSLRAIFTKSVGNYSKNITGLRDDVFSINSYFINENEDIATKINELGNQYQTELDIEKGKLMNIVIVNGIEESYLLVIIHHLVIDEVSWHVLLEDFNIGYEQLKANQPISFGDKTDSYKSYSENLVNFSEEGNVNKEKSYWSNVIKSINDYNSGEKLIAEFIYEKNMDIQLTISDDNTYSLLHDSNRAYNTQIQDLLLAALAMTIKSWKQKDIAVFDLESHGRENLYEETDVTRTIGWFTSIYPVVIPVDDVNDIKKNIIKVKEIIKKVPKSGIGYGLLKYVLKDPAFQTARPKICFNYLGVVSEAKRDNKFVTSSLQGGKEIGPKYKSDYYLEINCQVINNKLEISFSCSELEFNETDAKQLAQDYKMNLLKIMNHCMTKKEPEITPSDLSTESIDSDFMEEIFDNLYQ